MSEPLAEWTVTGQDHVKLPVRPQCFERDNHAGERDLGSAKLIRHAQAADSHYSGVRAISSTLSDIARGNSPDSSSGYRVRDSGIRPTRVNSIATSRSPFSAAIRTRSVSSSAV